MEPLWDEPPLALVEEFVASGGRAVVTCVDTDRLDASWLGRVIDEAFVRDIAALPVDPCGENGEYHSFAFAGPAFARPLEWRAGWMWWWPSLPAGSPSQSWPGTDS